ncbi:hypothetical protein [Niveibacterium sp. SC-1]|uniref:hypothetical protein n=1 Tax=Niveibacterium sp. SC-1 TaxID=3135646 RepID=UPI00311FFC6E
MRKMNLPPHGQRFTTGFRLVLWVLALSLAISIWMILDVHGEPYRDATAAWGLVIGFNLMVGSIAVGVAYQRLHLDWSDNMLRYANAGTFHRWKEVSTKDIESLQLVRAANRQKVMVDSLYIAVVRGPERTRSSAWLLDGRIFPISGNSISPHFAAVAALIRATNPSAIVDPALTPPA